MRFTRFVRGSAHERRTRVLPVVLGVAGVLALVAGCTSGSEQGAVVTVTTDSAATSPAATSSSQVTVSSSGEGTSNGQLPSSASSLTTSSTTSSSTPVLPSAEVTASPKFGTTDLSPSGAITIKVANGTIKDLTMTNPDGKVIKGTVAADKKSWVLGEVLGFGKTYTVKGTATGEDGKAVAIKGTYGMLSEDNKADSNITPGDGEVVGIAQPIIIRFPTEPENKAEIEKHLKITTEPEVEGSWGWIHHDDAWGIDWRPKDYWPANTKVHVEADLYGLKYADGMYGSTDLTTDFTIGRAQVVYADATTFQIVVKQGCTKANDPDSCTSTTATYPASYGSGDDIGDVNRVTRSGIHVVNELLPVHKMSNPEYGYENVTEYWDVRISNNGEFIHQNSGTVGDQGVVNVSHGCINLSAENAEAYFKSALIGDPVEVTGTSVQLSAADGDIFDWTVSWGEWQSLSAS
ncbi:L,D-transpeptidase family protein [Nakamurella sp. YIM 132087]|uniref:L,D-transpeptidase family protein n=1 Tax=Nakamurella alba TaxID=2665158 RepID=A0A7K1FGZ6_9ACTN|nr:Ig-like domain-containing protein [Nakamurella alba]MTD13391.1 L,D-transpeptidase family protein [Nakamurella alba]